MKQYKLINKTTGEEHICSKVVVDGFDYYVRDEYNSLGGFHYDYEHNFITNLSVHNVDNPFKEIIFTNNPNIDLPKVIDEVEELANDWYKSVLERTGLDLKPNKRSLNGFTKGYKKSQETHPNSDLDMIEFAINSLRFSTISKLQRNGKELLEIWKDKQIKTIQIK